MYAVDARVLACVVCESGKVWFTAEGGGGNMFSKGGLLFDLDCGDLGHLYVQKLQRLPRLSAECDLGYGNWTVIMTKGCSS